MGFQRQGLVVRLYLLHHLGLGRGKSPRATQKDSSVTSYGDPSQQVEERLTIASIL